MSRFGGGFNGGGGPLTYAPYIELPNSGYIQVGDAGRLFRANTGNLGLDLDDDGSAEFNFYVNTGNPAMTMVGAAGSIHSLAYNGNSWLYSQNTVGTTIRGYPTGDVFVSSTAGSGQSDGNLITGTLEIGTATSTIESGDVGAGNGTGEMFYDASADTFSVSNGAGNRYARLEGEGLLRTLGPTTQEGVFAYSFFSMSSRSLDIGDPSDDHMGFWMSDGTDTGNNGDLYMKINVGGTTKTVKLYDYTTNTIQ